MPPRLSFLGQHNRPENRLVILVLLAVLATVAASGWWLWQARQDAVLAAEQLVTSLARVAQERLDGAMRSVDLLLADTANKVAERPAAEQLNAYIKARVAAFPELRGIALINADGQMYYYSYQTSPLLDLSDREHFLVHRRTPQDQSTYLSRPLVDRATRDVSIFATRAINDPQGTFLGVASAVILPEFFAQTLTSVTPEPNGATAITNTQCEILSRVPKVENLIGQQRPADNRLCIAARAGGAGTFLYTTAADDVPRIVAYRSLANQLGIVSVGIPLEEALAHWRQQAWAVSLVELAVVSFMLAMAAILRRAEQRRSQLLDELGRTVKRLARSNEDLENFAYAASHDLQEPIRNIVRYSQLIARRYEGKLDPDADTFLNFIVESGWQLHDLINGVLAFSQIENTNHPFLEVDCETLLTEAQEFLADSIQTNQAVLTIQHPLPVLWGDPAQLALVFQQLLANAIKFHHPDHAPEIALSVRRLDQEWEFTVADNGIGIEPAHTATIFVIFKRLHSRQNYSGSGIGLALVKRIIQRHGGTIRVESTLGQGARFIFTLPVAKTGALPTSAL